MTASGVTVAEAGEDGVLAALREVIDPHNRLRGGLKIGPGDDAAVLATSLQPARPEVPEEGASRTEAPKAKTSSTVLTVDTMSEDQDFRLSWWKNSTDWQAGEAIGVKAAVQNLSDLNAMAATPSALLISLTLPAQTPVDWVSGFFSGVVDACQQPGAENCVIAGGDLGTGEKLSISITALGEPGQSGLLTRAGAQAGDVVAVSGNIGFAAAGLALLEAGEAFAGPHAVNTIPAGSHTSAHPSLDAFITAQTRPAPSLTSGVAALKAEASAGMDISDGLLRDAGRLASASDVRIHLHEAALAAEARGLEPAAKALGIEQSACYDWVLSGGEDYGLLATFSDDAALPEGFRVIGTVDHAAEQPGVDAPSSGSAGWDSLRR